jgi:ketosteroid isomerase-like protein
MTSESQELAVRYGEAWAARDLDAIMSMHTEDTVFHLHGGGEPAVGLGAVRDAFAAGMGQSPDIRFERKRVHLGTDHFVSEYRMRATKDGQQVECDGVDVFTVEGGRIARKDTYWDWPAIQRQLAESSPAPA